LIEVLNDWTTRTALQLCACFGEEEKVSQSPPRKERRRRWWRDTASGILRYESNEFKLRKVCDVAEFGREFREHFGVEVDVVSNFADCSPRCRNSEDDVVSEIKRHATVPQTSRT